MGAAAIPIMIGAQVVGGIQGAKGGIQAGKDQKNYYDYLAATSKTNAGLALAEGESDVNTLGEEEFSQEKALQTQGRAVVGAQKTALAGGGAGVGSKTGEQLVADTADKVNLNEQALQYNADVKMKNARLSASTQALNYNSQAAGYELAGKNAIRASNINAFSSLLSTAGQTAMSATKL